MNARQMTLGFAQNYTSKEVKVICIKCGKEKLESKMSGSNPKICRECWRDYQRNYKPGTPKSRMKFECEDMVVQTGIGGVFSICSDGGDILVKSGKITYQAILRPQIFNVMELAEIIKEGDLVSIKGVIGTEGNRDNGYYILFPTQLKHKGSLFGNVDGNREK